MNFIKNNNNKRREGNRRRLFPSKGKSRQAESTIDPSLFVKKAQPITETRYESPRTIKDLPVDERIKNNLTSKGYLRPTEIQDKTIESILANNNLMGIAQTGTGKTGAFLIPIVNKLINSKPSFQALVVVPTRELAVQAEQEFKSIVKGMHMYSACFIGGTSVGKDISMLRKPLHVVIGTPGRLTDLSRQGALSFSSFTTLILDEFDRLLDMGFTRDIQFIVGSMKNRKQTILFSATEEKSQRKLINELLHQPVEVRVSNGSTTGDHIDQEIVKVAAGESKIGVLLKMVRDKSFRKVIVFAETKHGVSNLRKSLHQSGIKVDEIHGNKSQNYRLKALDDFKSGRTQVLVATDVAARGLDISEVTHVINYQQPRDFDNYIHRIGRTGRAGKGGKAYTFIN